MTTCKLYLLSTGKQKVRKAVCLLLPIPGRSPQKATLGQAIGSRCTLSANHRAPLAPPATSLAWRHVEQEFRLCDDDSVAEEITAVMTVVR